MAWSLLRGATQLRHDLHTTNKLSYATQRTFYVLPAATPCSIHIRRHLSRMPRRCDALPSTNPVETMAEAAGYDLAKSGGWILSTSLHLTGSEVLCWILEGVSPSAAPSDVEVVMGPECKSGNVAGQRRRTSLGFITWGTSWVDASRRSPLVLEEWCGYLCVRCSVGWAKQQYCRRPTVHCLHRL